METHVHAATCTTAFWQNTLPTGLYLNLSALEVSAHLWSCSSSRYSTSKCSVVPLRPAHMVFVLSYGNPFVMGVAQENAVARRIHQYPRVVDMPDEMQKLRPCMPYAVNSLRLPRRQDGYLHTDCIKCGKCVTACPIKIMELTQKRDQTVKEAARQPSI